MPRPQDPAERPTAAEPPRWLGNLAIWAGAALALVVVVLLGVAVLPGWWAALVGGWVQGVPNRGAWLGFFLGALFTILPLGVALLAVRRGLTSRARIALVVIALLLLLPNVLTMAIALGRSEVRHVLAIQAPGLRGATVAGIVVVLVLAIGAFAIRARSRHTRRTLEKARVRAIQVGRERAAAAAAAAESAVSGDERARSPEEGAEPAATAGPEASSDVNPPGPDGVPDPTGTEAAEPSTAERPEPTS